MLYHKPLFTMSGSGFPRHVCESDTSSSLPIASDVLHRLPRLVGHGPVPALSLLLIRLHNTQSLVVQSMSSKSATHFGGLSYCVSTGKKIK